MVACCLEVNVPRYLDVKLSAVAFDTLTSLAVAPVATARLAVGFIAQVGGQFRFQGTLHQLLLQVFE